VTIAFDATSTAVAAVGTALTWLHTPTGTPRGVIVLVVQNVGSTDEVTGVTYGGTAMTAVEELLHSTGAEDGAVYAYFLGASVPTGPQTVIVSVNGIGSSKHAVAITVTGALDTVVEDTTTLDSAGAANPSVTVTIRATTLCFVAGALHSGQNMPTGIAPGAGYVEILEHDFGNQNAAFERRSALTSVDVAVNWTATSEESGVVGIAIRESLHTVTVGFATETDTGLLLGTTAKSKTVGIASETDTGLLAASAKVKTVGFAVEIDTAFSADTGQMIAVSFATETDTGLLLGTTLKTKLVGIATETDRARACSVIQPAIEAFDTFPHSWN
jgi:hypothetical protein